uniref:Ubiquitin carboxyl-terminal hydrolase n=1 Tax=Mucochytrium quahogii TaxID=96639 RepID=A0A7S2S4C7_9STRA|mmetsp:Transcript_24592/g.53231  ORF Transcript_24592/g.53231 Transcript_24592/m.53231 type:complete len:439 (+) Transcript_24592:413-1729(+)
MIHSGYFHRVRKQSCPRAAKATREKARRRKAIAGYPKMRMLPNSSQLRRMCKRVGKKIYGIPNIGNSCFMNSILQVLAQTPEFLNNLDRTVEIGHEDGRDVGFTSAVLQLLLAVRTGRIANVGKRKKGRKPPTEEKTFKRVDPRYAYGYIMDKAPQLGGFGQQDAHELLVEMFRGIEEDEADSKNTEGPNATGISRLLSTNLIRRVSCSNCENTTQTMEECVVTSLNIRTKNESISLPVSRCVQQTHSATKLLVSEGNGFQCDNCSNTSANPGAEISEEESVVEVLASLLDSVSLEEETGNVNDDARESCVKRDGLVLETFSRAPPVLVFHFKRFETTFIKGEVRCKKLNTRIVIGESESYLFDDVDVEYNLFGVVVHRGTTLTRGHYISYIKPYTRASDGSIVRSSRWWYASDSDVRPVDARQVFEDQVYICFYERA